MITLPLWLAGESLSYQRGRVNIGLDAEAAYQYLVKTRGLDPSSIVSLGQSLGTAVAVDLEKVF